MDHEFFLNRLYPFQDQVLHAFSLADTGFHLTGGTALSRGYLNHRFSDDLDFIVNDDERFVLWADRAIQSLIHAGEWRAQVSLREERYVRLSLVQADINLKNELVNDVPSRVGESWLHPIQAERGIPMVTGIPRYCASRDTI